MKSTGIVRRVDDLGRIVIPKEIRKNFKIADGEKLEIYVEDERIILKRFSPLYSSIKHCNAIVGSIKETLHKDVHVCDNNKIVSSSKKSLVGKKISGEYASFIKSSSNKVIKNTNPLTITDNEAIKVAHAIKPIKSYGDNIGSIIIEDTSSTAETVLNLSTGFFSEYTD